jgi:hypothetical protein
LRGFGIFFLVAMFAEIASRLSEANSYEEQAAFEELIHGSIATKGSRLKDTIAATEEIYARLCLAKCVLSPRLRFGAAG